MTTKLSNMILILPRKSFKVDPSKQALEANVIIDPCSLRYAVLVLVHVTRDATLLRAFEIGVLISPFSTCVGIDT